MDPQIIEQSSTPTGDDVESRIEQALYGSPQPMDDDGIDPGSKDNLGDDGDSTLQGGEVDNDEKLIDTGEEDVDLATYLGLESEQLEVDGETGDVTFLANVDGEQHKVKIQDLVKSYQLESYVNKKSQALSDERKQFNEHRTKQLEVISYNLDAGEALTKFAAQQLLSDYDGIDMNKLRVEAPAEWTAIQQEMQNKAAEIQSMLQDIEKNRKVMQETQNKEMMQSRQDHLKAEFDAMVLDNPNWIDEKVRKSDQAMLRDFLATKYGFSEQEFSMVSDHRLIRLIQDANAYYSGKNKAESKKTANIPKYQKPGNGNAQSTVKARQVKELKGNLRKTGSTRDAAALLENRM